MTHEEYQRLLKNEEIKRQEAATLAEQEARFNCAKEIREQENRLKRFLNTYIDCEKCDTISSIIRVRVEADTVMDEELDKNMHYESFTIDNVPRELAKQFIEMCIDILNEKFKHL